MAEYTDLETLLAIEVIDLNENQTTVGELLNLLTVEDKNRLRSRYNPEFKSIKQQENKMLLGVMGCIFLALAITVAIIMLINGSDWIGLNEIVVLFVLWLAGLLLTYGFFTSRVNDLQTSIKDVEVQIYKMRTEK